MASKQHNRTQQSASGSESTYASGVTLYRAPDHPKYRPAWQGATLVDANFVLEGGAMRGAFTAGVTDFLMDEGLLPKHTIGVSAGAFNGFFYTAGARGRSMYLNTKYCANWNYFSIRSFLVSGNAFNVAYTFDEIPNKLEPFDWDAYRNSPLDFVAVCSNVETGEAHYTQIIDPIEHMRYVQASGAMPLLSRIVDANGTMLLDGGSCDSVPIAYSKSTGVTKHIVVLTQHDGYIKKPNSYLPLIRLRYRRYPQFVKRLENRHLEYNKTYQQINQMAQAGEIFVIRPPERVTVSNMEKDPQKLFALHAQGYEEARRNFKALQNYLEL